MLVHLNGKLIPAHDAKISVFDRGFLFGDGVYEGLRATRGHIIGLDRHVERLREGLDETRIDGFDAGAIGPLSRELIEAQNLDSAFIYWQITRGTPTAGAARPRVPDPTTPPTVFAYATPLLPVDELDLPDPMSVALRPDPRWARGHLKSISLLGSVLAAFEAHESGADDAIMHAGGLVTEGTATNIFTVLGGDIVTPTTDGAPILHGVTRRLVLEAVPGIVERAIRVDELREASEIMLVGTRTMVAPITSVDDQLVGDGSVGHVARELHEALIAAILREARESVHV